MTTYAEIQIGDLFEPRNGCAKFIKDYIDAQPGEFPVYSAALLRPFGFVDTFDYDGTYLSWVMNGYGGRVREISGRFSVNRDRGVFVPRAGVKVPDLTYLRHAMEPQLVDAAVGRRVDGLRSDYIKIYPETAAAVQIRLPFAAPGVLDYERMTQIGKRLRGIEAAQHLVRQARQPLERAVFSLDVPAPARTVYLSDETTFSLSIGERVLRRDYVANGVPIYSANVLTPAGLVEKSNLTSFAKPSILWGIDNTNFDWSYVPAGVEFATTDHCGRLQILDERLDPEYVFLYLQLTREPYGFDRVLRASLQNIRAEVSVVVPLNENGEPCLTRQRAITTLVKRREAAKKTTLDTLDDVLRTRMAIDL